MPINQLGQDDSLFDHLDCLNNHYLVVRRSAPQLSVWHVTGENVTWQANYPPNRDAGEYAVQCINCGYEIVFDSTHMDEHIISKSDWLVFFQKLGMLPLEITV